MRLISLKMAAIAAVAVGLAVGIASSAEAFGGRGKARRAARCEARQASVTCATVTVSKPTHSVTYSHPVQSVQYASAPVVVQSAPYTAIAKPAAVAAVSVATVAYSVASSPNEVVNFYSKRGRCVRSVHKTYGADEVVECDNGNYQNWGVVTAGNVGYAMPRCYGPNCPKQTFYVVPTVTPEAQAAALEAAKPKLDGKKPTAGDGHGTDK
jgi:hypothetical protein